MIFYLKKKLVADLKQGKISTHDAKEEVKADCTISISDEDFIGLASGTANPQQVFILFRIKIPHL